MPDSDTRRQSETGRSKALVIGASASFLLVAALVGILAPHMEYGPAARRALKYPDIAYVANGSPRQRLDLYRPRTSARVPVVMWVHGGAWETGARKDVLVLDLLADGYAVASVDYRLSGEAPFPAQLEDCKTAVRWLKAHAATYGLDPGLIVATGSSAGGHLAAMLGLTGHIRDFDVGDYLQESSGVDAVVDFFGPTDLTAFTSGELGRAVKKLLGPSSAGTAELGRRASPLAWVAKGMPPTLIVHGASDDVVPIGQSVRFHDALRSVGAVVEMWKIPGGHDRRTVLRAMPQVRRFLSRVASARGQSPRHR